MIFCHFNCIFRDRHKKTENQIIELDQTKIEVFNPISYVIHFGSIFYF